MRIKSPDESGTKIEKALFSAPPNKTTDLMRISIDISMYPLQPNYADSILQFIEQLRQYPDIYIETNRMSTHIIGEYDQIMALLTKEIRQAFEADPAIVMVLKIINRDLK
jgi:uncharacterized protein YqgV (UPF0045/DUF77 family)